MKNYIFIVRPWNVEFFIELGKLIQLREKACKISYWTLQLEAFEDLKQNAITAVYLPIAFEQAQINDEIVANVDEQLNNKFNLCINLLYEIERYKVDYTQTDKFIGKQVCFFEKSIPENADLISLTVDHFTYMLAAYQNSLKNGHNYMLHPTGFPLNANVIASNPWDLNRFRKEAVNFSEVEAYRETLNKPPQQTIHYMQARKLPKFKNSLKLRWQAWQKKSPPKGLFSYLEKPPKRFEISRFKKEKMNIQLDYLSLQSLIEIANNRKVFYFPLQYEPEMSILAYSPYFKDQMEIIRLISQSLKYGDLLVLKENPKMLGKRDKSFYLNTLNLPNVRWLKSAENSRELIKVCYKTVSVTGTATIEAAVLGKNSMIFGYPPFRSLLIQKPVSEVGLSQFKEILYRNYTSKEIEKHLVEKWPEFSKAVFFGDFIPRLIGLKVTTANTTLLATDFYHQILVND